MRSYIDRIRYKSRMAKFNLIMNFFKPGPADRFLEVGVANKEYSIIDNFVIKVYPYRENITALGVGDFSKFNAKYPDVNTFTYDGTSFPFLDKYFDIAHSNAVIEHVGPFRSQELFIKEIVRVSKRGMITTPNKYFPIETHTKLPILHWLRKERFDRCLRWLGKDWAAGEYMFLLGEKDLVLLAESAGIKNYRLIKNRFLGLTMTFSLMWGLSYS